MAECGSEERAVDGGLAGGARVVHLQALGAEHADGVVEGDVGQAHGQHRLALAEGPGTAAEMDMVILRALHNIHSSY